MPEIIQAETVEQIDAARELFREYEAWLKIDLCFQDFEAELAELPGKYVPPEGRLFLAYQDQYLAGCIALRKLHTDVCEMKRLFVRDAFRGARIGIHLMDRLIKGAREIGYKKMRLDTYPAKMTKAVSLYESHGFYQIDPYYDNPHADVLFMEKRL